MKSEDQLIEIAKRLDQRVGRLGWGRPVEYVYNPLQYAWSPHALYLERFGGGKKDVLLIGMNPGPWGMAQTGVPFGAVPWVRDWMGIEANVATPSLPMHPRCEVTGFACKRVEVSGQRLWGWAKDRFGSPENFFSRFFVLNYCPLMFLTKEGANVTPDKLPSADRARLVEHCDEALSKAIRVLGAKIVVGVGGFAAGRVQHVLAGTNVVSGRVLHPSPASPQANRNWAGQAEESLRHLGVAL